jgi:hypothetical protein
MEWRAVVLRACVFLALLRTPFASDVCPARIAYVVGEPIVHYSVEDSFAASPACGSYRPPVIEGHSVVSVGVSRCGRVKLSDVVRGLDWVLHSHGHTPGMIVMSGKIRGHPLVEDKLARLADRLDVVPHVSSVDLMTPAAHAPPHALAIAFAFLLTIAIARMWLEPAAPMERRSVVRDVSGRKSWPGAERPRKSRFRRSRSSPCCDAGDLF